MHLSLLSGAIYKTSSVLIPSSSLFRTPKIHQIPRNLVSVALCLDDVTQADLTDKNVVKKQNITGANCRVRAGQ